MKNLSKARSFIFYLVAATITIVIGVVCLPAFFFAKLNIKVARCWIKIILALLKVICKINFKIIGKENIRGGAFVVISKHQSALETLVFPLIILHPIFILKKSILFIPVMGLALKSARAIYIDRSKGRDSILQMKKQLQELSKKDAPVIFPEGTRTEAGKRTEKYHSGAAMIYEALQWPVVPVAVNTGMFWPKSGKMKSGTATIKILPPIFPPKKYDRKQFLKQINEVIESNSIELYKNTLSKS
jgi:1-acyl-sn-glycerol-3-phosphate acyltransferase